MPKFGSFLGSSAGISQVARIRSFVTSGRRRFCNPKRHVEAACDLGRRHNDSLRSRWFLRKWVWAALCAAAFVAALPSAQAELVFTVYGAEATVSQEGGVSGDIVIPSTFEGVPVTEIAESAFYGCSGITSITIPSSVTRIEGNAFHGCSGLTSLTIPNSVTRVGDGAFMRCTGLQSPVFNQGKTTLFAYPSRFGDTSYVIPSTVTEIGSSAFFHCFGLSSLEIPNSVTRIGDYAFEGCSRLTSLVIPNSVNRIGRSVFNGCSGIESPVFNEARTKLFYYPSILDGTAYAVPDGVTSIEDSAFVDCNSTVRSITLPSSVVSIGQFAFSGCSGLTSVAISNGLIQIGYAAFKECTGLNSVDIPSSVRRIEGYAFDRCSGLTSVKIPNGVASIEEFTFYGCSGLTNVSIPNSVTFIGPYAFYGCSGLRTPILNEAGTTLFSYPQSSMATSYVIPSTVTKVEDYAFLGCYTLVSVTIPEGVKSIGFYAFLGCTGLTNITIPNSVTSIGSDAFTNCIGLLSPVFNEARTTLYFYPPSLQAASYAIPDSVTSIGRSAFHSCSSLKSITIPDSVTSIEDFAFFLCNGLTSVTIPRSVTRVGESVFGDCEELKSVTIFRTLKQIGENAFGNATVSVVSVPGTVEFIAREVSQLKAFGEIAVPVRLRRVGGTDGVVGVRVAVTGGTLPTESYRLPGEPTTVTWADGEDAEKTVSVIIRLGAAIAPTGDTIVLELQSAVGAALGALKTCTIRVRPFEPGILGFAGSTVERVKPASGDLSVNLPVKRARGSTGVVSAEVVVAGGTARAGDFTISTPVRLEWADGDTADKLLTVVFKESAQVPAAGRTIQFRLQNFSGGAMAGGLSSATLMVRAANLPGTLQFSAPTFSQVKASSGDTLVPITVNRELGGNGAVSVQVIQVGGTASAGNDFTLPSDPISLSWADDEMGPKTFNVVLKETAEIAGGTESLLLKLQTVSGGAQLGRVSNSTVSFFASDTAGPVLVLESPANRAPVTGEAVLFKGTATDASGVARVEVTLNSETPQEAALMPSPNGNMFGWMTTLIPEQGVNTVKVQAFDGSGNASAMLSRQFTFLYSRPALAGTFDGRLEAVTDKASLADPGQLQQFVQTGGEGLLTASVSATGAFSGKLTTGGIVAPFKGVIRRDGVAWFDSKTDFLEVVKGRGAGRVVLGSLSIRVQETGELPRLAGELVSETTAFGRGAAEKFVYSAARVLPPGMRRVPVEILNPVSENGRYTAILEPRVDDGLETNGGLPRTDFPQASGYAKVTVAPSGIVSLAGRLADGTPVSYSNRLSPGGTVPVYLPLYAGRGFLAGTPVFDDSLPDTDLAGTRMLWVRPAGLAAPFAEGWEDGITIDMVGSKYVPVTKPTRAVPVPENPYTVFGRELPVIALGTDSTPSFVGLRVEIAGGGLTTGTTDDGQLSPSNVFKTMGSPDAAGLKLLFATADGGFTGSFMHPITNKAQAFAGVVLQKVRRAGGVFVFLPPRGSAAPAAVGSVEITVP